MVFKARGAHTFKLRVVLADRRSATCSTGTADRKVAKDVEAMVKRFRAQRRWDVLEPVVTKQVTLAQVYDAYTRGTLDTLLADLRDVDLDPLVTEWAQRANAKYVTQVRTFIPEGQRFPASRFRRRDLSVFLAGLACADPTKNRYRAALSVFGKWLVEREVLDTNPLRDVAAFKERDPRMVWMPWKDAQRVADAAPEPFRTLFALMAATGMELGAALRLTTADADGGTIHARGSKTVWRNRVVRVEPWGRPYLTRAIRGKLGAVALFPGINQDDARRAFRHAQKAAGLAGHRIHDLRHTYAVNALKQGYKPHVVAFQLGHKDATMVLRCYGRFIPDAADYEVSATNPATNREKEG